MIELNFNIKFEDLYSISGLRTIDEKFLDFLNTQNPTLMHDLVVGRENTYISSELILHIAPHLENFIITLFNLKYSQNNSLNYHKKASALFECKKRFIQRKISIEHYDEKRLNESVSILCKAGINLDDELSIATHILKLQEDNNEKLLEFAKIYVSWALYNE